MKFLLIVDRTRSRAQRHMAAQALPSLRLTETRQVCENLIAVFEAASSSLAEVAKLTIYMADLEELLAMNEVSRGCFPTDPPARTTFQAARHVAEARAEIEAIAIALR